MHVLAVAFIVCRPHVRMAETFRKGRVFVAGGKSVRQICYPDPRQSSLFFLDAAHVHTPFGGQGLNSSIQDAVCLPNLHEGSSLSYGLAGQPRLEALPR